MAGPDNPDWTDSITLIPGDPALAAGVDYPDWTDGVYDVTGTISAGEDFPDWVKAVGQVTLPIISPTDVSDLTGWWDASQITGLADGAAVTSWPDASGLGRPQHPSTLGRTPPTYYKTTSAKLVNGLPAVWVDKTQTGMAPPSEQYVSATDGSYSVYVVAHGDGTTDAQAPAGADELNPTTRFYRIVLEPALTVTVFNNAGTAYTISGGTPSSVAVNVFSLAVDGTGLAAQAWLNGVSQGTAALTGPLSKLDSLPALGDYGDGFHSPLGGPVCEMILYSTAHDPSTQASVYAYLKQKWGTL